MVSSLSGASPLFFSVRQFPFEIFDKDDLLPSRPLEQDRARLDVRAQHSLEFTFSIQMIH